MVLRVNRRWTLSLTHMNTPNPPAGSSGTLVKADGKTPEVQQEGPFKGYYISTTAFQDKRNPHPLDPKKYVDASKINYVVLGSHAKEHGVRLCDFEHRGLARARHAPAAVPLRQDVYYSWSKA
jgi:hypothetical protein